MIQRQITTERRTLAVWGHALAVDFLGHPMFQQTGFDAPTRFEADVHDCEVWGKIPTDIEGNFYRMQCDFQYRPPRRTNGPPASMAMATSRRMSR
jgi:hypothetical protein